MVEELNIGHDFRMRLRKKDFPQCAVECLSIVEQIVETPIAVPIRYLRDLQIAIDESLFCITQDRWGAGAFNNKLSPLQELQLCHLLCRWYANKIPLDISRRNTYFEILYRGRDGDPQSLDYRLGFLPRICSIAVQLHCLPLLLEANRWLLKNGLMNRIVRPVFERLTDDYCSLKSQRYSDLFYLAAEYDKTRFGKGKLEGSDYTGAINEGVPPFACSFFASALTSMNQFQLPCRPLLEVLNYWIQNHSSTCLLPFKGPIDDVLPESVQQNVCFHVCQTVSKLALICIVVPMRPDVDDSLLQLTALLHAGILKLMIAAQQFDDFIIFQSTDLVECLRQLKEFKEQSPPERISLATDRFLQILQVCSATKALRGTKKEIAKCFYDFNFKHPLAENILR